MSDEKPTFERKWQAVLYDLFDSFLYYNWESLSIEDAFYVADKKYLERHGIKGYSSFEHHVRRLHQWGYLYRVPNPDKPSKYYPIPEKYLISKAAINKIEKWGILKHEKAKEYKKTIEWVAYDYGIKIRRNQQLK